MDCIQFDRCDTAKHLYNSGQPYMYTLSHYKHEFLGQPLYTYDFSNFSLILCLQYA